MSGGAYVLFGDVNGIPAVIDDQTLDGLNGLSISGRHLFEEDDAGLTISSLNMVSDTNGDQLDDLLIATLSTGNNEGQVELIPGRADWPARIDADELALVLGRQEQNAPASPANFYPAYARSLIELRWQAGTDASTQGFEPTRDDELIASLDITDRRCPCIPFCENHCSCYCHANR